MQRLYEFLRRHPTWTDSFWAVVIFGPSAGMAMAGRGPRDGLDGLLVALALSAAVALRRRMPEWTLLLAIAAGLGQLALDLSIMPADLGMLVIVYTVSANGPRWASRLGLAAGLCAPALAELRWPVASAFSSGWTRVAHAVLLTVPFALAWVIGDSVRTRRAYYAQLEERAERLQREREAQSQVAVAAERARIARELHDVVAHNVSVMVVQADGAAYVLDTAPEQARQALSAISQTGRLALAEMRRLLGLLRASDDSGGEYVPQPGVDQIGELIDQVRCAGLPVDFAVTGPVCQLPSGVELTAYRIVQEALTNTRKHGGPTAHARVRLCYGDHRLRVLIEDDGRGEPAGGHQEGGEDGLGQGLIGMRERVAMVDGTLHSGPRPGGGFRIRAELPLKPVAEPQRP